MCMFSFKVEIGVLVSLKISSVKAVIVFPLFLDILSKSKSWFLFNALERSLLRRIVC